MKLLFFIFFLLGSLTGPGQGNDYLVKTNGDTLYGSIELKNKSFHVSGPNSSAIEVSIDEVKKIRSGKYKGNTVVHCLLQIYTDNLDELEFDWIKRKVIDTVLILDEIVTTPKINLYYGQDNIKTPFYFYKTPSDNFPVQLVVRYYLQGGIANYIKDPARYRGDRSKVNIVEEKGYVNQLYFIMKDCDNIPKAVWEIVTYRNYSLRRLIKRYNKCN